MATNDHEDDENPLKSLYKLGKTASIFYDPSQTDGKILPGQAIELENTERVQEALQKGHIVLAKATDVKKYDKKVEEATADLNATKTLTSKVGAASLDLLAEAQANGDKVVADAQAQAQQILADAQSAADGHITKGQADGEKHLEQAKKAGDESIRNAKDAAAEITGKAKLEADKIIKAAKDKAGEAK